MRRGGWLLTLVVLGMAAWMVFAPVKPAPVLTLADMAGCYAGGGVEVHLRADGTMRADGMDGRYHIAPGVQGSRPQAVVPDRIVARADTGRLRFVAGGPTDRWSIAGGRQAYLSVAGVKMMKGKCGSVTS